MSTRRLYCIRRIILILLLLPTTGVAQPELKLYTLLNRWPTIEMDFQAWCNGERIYPADTAHYRIYDNERQVSNYFLRCFDPRERLSTSVAMVFDASAIVDDNIHPNPKTIGSLFIELFDGASDEAAIIRSGESQSLLLGMTSEKLLLKETIAGLDSGACTAIWDGVYAGVSEVAAHANNWMKGVVVFTSGRDSASIQSFDSLIAHANRHRVRVYPVGFGDVDEDALEELAWLTGGHYYYNPSASQVASIYDDLTTIIISRDDCIVTYSADRADGLLHTVKLVLLDECGGSDTLIATYHAPMDTTTGVRSAQSLATQFSIAPNPNNGVFEVALEFEKTSAFGMRIVNTLGQTMYERYVTDRRISYHETIEFAAPPGVYFLMLESHGTYLTHKLIVH